MDSLPDDAFPSCVCFTEEDRATAQQALCGLAGTLSGVLMSAMEYNQICEAAAPCLLAMITDICIVSVSNGPANTEQEKMAVLAAIQRNHAALLRQQEILMQRAVRMLAGGGSGGERAH